MTASGGRIAALRERLLRRRRRLDLVARAAEVRLERPQDLRLVVDDEDAASHDVAAGCSATRERERERGALARPRLGPDAAAVRLGEAACDREPEPGARGPSSPRAVERLEDPLELAPRRSPAPWSTTRTIDLLPRRGDPHAGPSRPAARTCSAFSSRFASTRSIWVASTRTGATSCAKTTSTRSEPRTSSSACATSSSTVQSSGARRRRVRLQAREVEQVRDEPVEASGLDARSSRPARRGRRRRASAPSLRSPSAAARIAVSGERRSWRDRLEDRRLDRVAPPQRVGLDGLALQALAVDRDARAATPAPAGSDAALGEARRLALREVERADQAPVRLEDDAAPRPPAARGGRARSARG